MRFPRRPSAAGRAPRSARRLATLAAVGLVAAACGTATESDPTADDGAGEETTEQTDEQEVATGPTSDLLVVATTSILGDVVGNLVGDDGTVDVIMPPGADPHGFQPAASDAAMLREADLVVANGLQLEESLIAALEAAEEDGVRVLELAEHLDPIEFEDDGHGHADEDDGQGHADEDDDHGHADEDDGHGHADDDDHDHGPEDPHVWFDPVRMADGVRLLAAELAEVDDHLDADEWERRGDAYAEEVLAVHDELEELFATIPDEDRKLVTNHDALGYLAHRYGFEVLATVVPGSSTQAEADARQFSQLIQTVEEAGVTAVFAENTDSTTLAEQLASEVAGRSDVEIEVVRLYTDALGEPGSGAETYLDLLRTTGQRITDALG
jgi:zinc/manganese transport system substrate-binding protein